MLAALLLSLAVCRRRGSPRDPGQRLRGPPALLLAAFASAASAQQLANVALTGTARASGALSPNGYYIPYVNDGNAACADAQNAIAALAPYPWMSVDLGRVYTVSRITIFGRAGYEATQSSPLAVYVGTDQSNNGLSNPSCASGITALAAGTNVTSCGGVSGRFVTVRLETTGSQYLSLCEIQVWASAPSPPPPFSAAAPGLSLVNLALTGVATQRATYGATPRTADAAIDGTTACDAGGNEVGTAIVDTAVNNWWQVDLQAAFTIDSISIFGRTSYSQQSHQLSVYLSSSSSDPITNGGANSTLCASMVDAPNTGTTVLCGNAVGKYVTIVNAQPVSSYLSLCEVQVWGYAPAPPPMGGYVTSNIAPWATAVSIVPALAGYQAAYLNDGVTGPTCDASNNLVGASSAALNGYAMIDLGYPATVATVGLWGRTAAYTSQSSNLTIFVGSNATAGGTTNPMCAVNAYAPYTGANVSCNLVGRYVTVQQVQAAANNLG